MPAMNPDAPRPVATSGPLAGLTRNVFVLGLVSLFTDVSSEMIVPIRMIFLVSVLGTPVEIAGLIEGIAESTASVVKLFSGQLADRVHDRKPLLVAGYGFSNVVKPLLALVLTWPQALGIMFLDRVGKGVRGSPRDAILADSAPAAYRGKAFGFHRGMDTLGAAIGPLAAAAILALHNNDVRMVFAWTALPGLLSVLVLVLFLRDRRAEAPAAKSSAAEAGPLGRRFWFFAAIATLFALGNSSDAFLFLRSEQLVPQMLAAVPLMYFFYNIVYALLAAPLGALSDRWGRLPLLAGGYLAFALVYAGWTLAAQAWHAVGLFLVYGVYAAATEGVSRALVTDLIPRTRRGVGMGWFNALTGLSALPANLLGGWLWDVYGPGATFAAGAVAALLAALLLVAGRGWLRGSEPVKG
jgi:MFS family permease